MRLKWKVTIRQENLAPEYKGEIELLFNDVQGFFSFHHKLDPGYRATVADNPFLAFERGGENYLKAPWPVLQHEYDTLPDEKRVMLVLMGQMVGVGVKKIMSEHGLSSPEITSEILSAMNKTLQSETRGEVEVEDVDVQRFIREACKVPV